MSPTVREPTPDQISKCPAMTLPPELWMSILRYFNKKNASARRQLYYVALVSSSFHTMALPLLYSQLTLSTYSPFATHPHPYILNGQFEPLVTIPAVTAVRTLVSRPALQGAVKSIQFIGHIDTVVLSRRTSARTSDILDASDLRDLFVSTLPLLTSLQSITFSAVALTSELCAALFYLPRLERLTLKDCRAPAPASSIFRERPGEINLKYVELIFGAWTDTPTEVELMATFFYGPSLKSITTDQPRVLTSFLAHEVTAKLCHLELRHFREGDAPLVAEFLAHDSCSALRALVLDDCEFPQRAPDTEISFTGLPDLQMYSGPLELAHWFVVNGANVQHMRLREPHLHEHNTDKLDVAKLAISGGMLSLDIQLRHESLLDDTMWATLGGFLSMLRVLRIEHDVAAEVFQTHVFPKCLATLPAMKRLEKLVLVAPGLLLDPQWQSAAVHNLAQCQPMLQEILLSMDDAWIRLARTEWKMFKTDEL